jgi:hypothetical protein
MTIKILMKRGSGCRGEISGEVTVPEAPHAWAFSFRDSSFGFRHSAEAAAPI